MSNRFKCSTFAFLVVLLGSISTQAEACWWHHRGHHCHRCSGSSSSSSTASSSQSQQAMSADQWIALINALRPGAGDNMSGLESKIDALTTKVDAMAGVMEKVEANTVEIDRLKTAHEAVANRVSTDYVTKAELDAKFEEFNKTHNATITKTINDKFDAEFKVFNSTQNSKFEKLFKKIGNPNLKNELYAAFTPFEDKERTKPLPTEWPMGTLLEVLDKTTDANVWKVKNAEGAEGWLSKSLVKEISFE